MKRTRPGFTIVEFVVVVGIVMLVALFILALTRKRAQAPAMATCEQLMSEVARAIASYTNNNGGYFPFSWGPASLRNGAERPKDALTSLAALYPDYLTNERAFRCPQTEAAPHFVLNLPHDVLTAVRDADGDGLIGPADVAGTEWETAYAMRNWTLVGSSYGYDCRVTPRIAGGHAIYADMDGSWMADHRSTTQNHRGGQNVLYADGHIAWKETNFASSDPLDDIYVEDATSPDMDSYVSDNTDPAKPSDPTANVFHLEYRPPKGI